MNSEHNTFIPFAYIKWHYSQGLIELNNFFNNIFWFVLNFFSIRLLIRTLFSPWHMMGESYGDIFKVSEFMSSFVVNILMRIVGFIFRVLTIFISFVFIILTIASFVVSFVVWIFAPIIAFGLPLTAISVIAIN
jgi:hypothetical protein